MKRFFLILAVLLVAVSCSKDTPAKYSVIWDINLDVSELTIWECDDYGSKLTSHVEYNVGGGDIITYTAVPEATKVKIYIEIEDIQMAKWVQQVYLLEKGETIRIVINGDTIVGNNEP